MITFSSRFVKYIILKKWFGRAKNPERVPNPRKIRIKPANVGVIKSKKLNSFVFNIIKYIII
jgi:hypothetical protein